MKMRRRNNSGWMTKVVRFGLVSCLSIVLASCGGGGDDDGGNGGIIGTGIQLKGTTSDQRTYASNEIEYKAASGETGRVAFGADGRFFADELQGESPYLLRADLGNNDYLYSLGYADSSNVIQQNVHDYTDLVTRNLFASTSLDIDAQFEAAGALTNVPSETQFAAIVAAVLSIVTDVLADYGAGGVDPFTADYAAGGAGLGEFLSSNPVLINNGTINIVINDPVSGTQGVASQEVPLTTSLAAPDAALPSTPEDVRVVPDGDGSIIIVWAPSSDNIGVSTYQVLRDGELLDTTPYPVFIDDTLTSDAAAGYSIIAIDAAGNESAETVPVNVINSAEPDNTPPNAPVSLVLVPTTDSVLVQWAQTGIDDVVAFNVFRGQGGSANTLLAPVSSTFLIDADVESGTEFCYRVTAEDAAGNESASTDVLCTTTEGQVVTTTEGPGTTPGAGELTVSFANSTAQVLEDASSVAILVSRVGPVDEAVAVNYEVTSGTATAGVDFTAQSGTLTWDAGDSSDQRILVQVAADAEIEGDETFLVTLSNPSSNASIAGGETLTVTISDRVSPDCSTVLEPTTIVEDTVLDLSCYIVESGINVTDGTNLTIAAGTRLEFESGTELYVAGSLTANGNEENPIVLTGREATPGYWDGVQFYFTNSTANRLSNVVIEYGGGRGSNAANLYVRSSAVSPTRISIDSVTSRHSFADGLNFESGIIFGSFTNNVITLNERAAEIHVDATGVIDTSSSFAGNTEDLVVIDSGSLTRDGTLAGIDAAWFVDAAITVQDGTTLTIEPGADIIFDQSTGIRVDQNAEMLAVGTADNPIVMRSKNGQAGGWDGIQIYFQVSQSTRLEYVNIRDAGSSGNANSAIQVRSSGTSPSTLSLKDVAISNSAGTGISVNTSTTMPQFENVTVTGSASPAIMHPDTVSQIGTGNVFTGNTEDLIAVTVGTIDETALWRNTGVPYLIEDVTVNNILTLEPGVEIWGNQSALLRINQTGALNAQGTPAQPIVLRGAMAIPGYWEGIQFYFTPLLQNVLSNVTVQHGGGGSHPANVYMRCSTTSPGQLMISDSVISDSAEFGVEVAVSGCTYTETNVTFSNNASGDYNGPQ